MASGASSLPAESDGVVRYVPLLVAVGDQLMPGLSIEFVELRVARPPSAPVEPAHADDGRPANSAQRGRLLRLIPNAAITAHDNRTVSAVDILNQRTSAARLNGATVLIGGSAPELGGLRQTVSGSGSFGCKYRRTRSNRSTWAAFHGRSRLPKQLPCRCCWSCVYLPCSQASYFHPCSAPLRWARSFCSRGSAQF